MKMNKLDNMMVYWLVAQFCSLIAKSVDEWMTYDDIKESDEVVWRGNRDDKSKWFKTYQELSSSWWSNLTKIKRDTIGVLEVVFAEIQDNAKK